MMLPVFALAIAPDIEWYGFSAVPSSVPLAAPSTHKTSLPVHEIGFHAGSVQPGRRPPGDTGVLGCWLSLPAAGWPGFSPFASVELVLPGWLSLALLPAPPRQARSR